MVDLEQTDDVKGETTTPRQHRRFLWPPMLFAALFLATLAGGVFWWKKSSAPPSDFPIEKLIVIPSGATLEEIAIHLKEEHVIRSPVAFTLLVRYKGAESRIMAGEYLFSSPLNLAVITARIIGGEHGILRFRVTFPEGTSLSGMGRILKSMFSQFDDVQFATLAKGSEGYLFPDTYFFFSNATSGSIIDVLKKNFLEKTDSLYKEALANKKNWSDVIIMASILEEEAATPKDRRIVSGVLWKRLAKNMYLGVDSPFAYAIGKNSATLTTLDLKSDIPYNTYLHKGLPPTAITNPGLDAIDAALHPESSPYFYYLSDKNGTIYYAKTFDEHKRNKERYIR